MALQKQVVSMPFSKGLDTKTDAKLSAKPSRVENAVFRGGTLQKPFGSTALTSAIDTGGNQTKGEALFPFGTELVRINGGTTYGLATGATEWVTKPGGAHYATVSRQRIQRNMRTQQQPDQATVNGITVFAWTEPSGPQIGLHVAVMDEATGTFYQTGGVALSNPSGTVAPRCVAVGNYVHVYFRNGGSLQLAIVNTTTPETVPSISTITSGMATNLGSSGGTYNVGFAGFEAAVSGSSVVVAYVPSSPTTNDSLTVLLLSSAGGITNSVTLNTLTDVDGTPIINNIGAIGILTASTGDIFIVYSDGGNAGSTIKACYYLVLSSTLTTRLAKTQINAAVVFATVALVEASAGHVTCVFMTNSVTGTGAFGTAVLTNTGISTAYASIPGTSGIGMATDAVVWDGAVVLGVASTARGNAANSLQPTGFVIDTSGNVVARCLPGVCSWQVNSHVPRTLTIGGNPRFLFSERGRLQYSSTTGHTIDVTPAGLTRVTLASANAGGLPLNRIGETVYIGGACPRIYDGQQVVEEGFPQYPEGITLSFGGSGGNLAAGAQYQYKALYSWVDARGQLHRSAASPPVTGTPTSGQMGTVTVPVLPLSSKDLLPQGAAVQIELYRTEGNGTNFYRVGSASNVTFNSTTALTVSLPADGTSDASLISGELLYVTGGVYDWMPPPAYTAACEHKGRLVIVGLEDPYAWQSSSVTIQGEALRFNPSWGGRVPASTGPLVACASMDGNLFLFTSQACYLVQGDGPDLLGNNPWPAPQLLPSVDAGPQGYASMVVAPDGIWFQSAKGLARLDRQLGFEYVGADVEAYSQYTFREAVLRPEVEQLWFHCDLGTDSAFGQGVALVWDYHYSQWSVLTGAAGVTFGAQDACYWNGAYVRVNAAGAVLQESTSTYLQNGAAISSVVETDWVKLAGVQGFARLWRALVLGTYGSDFTLTWDAAYNYVNTYAAADTVTLVGNGVFTVGAAFQLRRLLRQQKCEAVKFRFTDSAIGGNGQGMALSDLSLEFGLRSGAWKLPTAQSLG